MSKRRTPWQGSSSVGQVGCVNINWIHARSYRHRVCFMDNREKEIKKNTSQFQRLAVVQKKFCLGPLGSCARHLSALELFDVQTFKSMKKKVTGKKKKILLELPVTGQSLITANNADFPFIITTTERQGLCLQSMLFGRPL